MSSIYSVASRFVGARYGRAVFLLGCLFPYCVLAVTGCGEKSNTLAVRGKVAYQGKPLASGAISFYPEKGQPVFATLSPDGDYQIELGPGEYAVTIAASNPLPPGFEEGDVPPPPKFVLPEKYSILAKSTLTAKVLPDQSEPIDFRLE
jgi:hypothetical protein